MKAQDPEPHHDRLVRQTAGLDQLGIGRTTAWRRMNPADPAYDPDFPPRIQIGPGRFGFRLSDLQRYIQSRPAAPFAPAPTKAVEASVRARAGRAQERRAKKMLAASCASKRKRD